ncbi:MAG: DoxX-like family protein [Verrucomicrobiales bacterium]
MTKPAVKSSMAAGSPPHVRPIPIVTLYRLKLACRLSVGFVWVWEGLVPKIISPGLNQFAMIRRSAWWWGTPELTLHLLGWAMVAAGLVIMSGYRERITVLVASIALLVLMALVMVNEPSSIIDPYGGLAKDACLFACAAVVWCLAPAASSGKSH